MACNEEAGPKLQPREPATNARQATSQAHFITCQGELVNPNCLGHCKATAETHCHEEPRLVI